MAANAGVSLLSRSGRPLDELVRVGLRRNPRRAHLLVSTVLGKHLPTPPRVVHDAGLALGARVRALLAGGPTPVVIGYAETATGLGQTVAEALDADYAHSTRRVVPGASSVIAFEEEHSHASTHQLLVDASFLDRDVVVLVDDELSTGRTAVNTIAALERQRPRSRYVVAALVDVRGEADRAELAGAAADLGVAIDVVALAAGDVELPADLPQRVAELERSALARAELEAHQPGSHRPRASQPPPSVTLRPAATLRGGRHGVRAEELRAMRRDVERAAELVAGAVSAVSATAPWADRRVLVLGVEECMDAPLRIALELEKHRNDVSFSTSTRSPAHVVDEPEYPLRSALSFAGGAADLGGEGPRFAYNVPTWAAADDVETHVVVVSDGGDDRGLLGAVDAIVDHTHHVRLGPT